MKILATIAISLLTLAVGATIQPGKASAATVYTFSDGRTSNVWDPNGCEPEQWFRADNLECIDKTGVKSEWDPNNCEPERWIRADNKQCIDKKPRPVAPVQAAPAPAPVSAPAPAPKPAPAAPAPRPAPVSTAGSGCEWLRGRLAANGIAGGDIPAAINIATKESGCNPRAQNRSSGACNVFQELPCGKWGGLSNTDAHIRGADAYAKNRYGGWWGAWKAWQSKHWW